jgi:hypothetical protein
MKHVKELVLEGRRNFKSYKKYIDIINKKFKPISNIEGDKTDIFKENGKINVSFKMWHGVNKTFITFATEIFGDVN